MFFPLYNSNSFRRKIMQLLLFFQTSFMLSCELKVGECLKEGRKNGSIILKHLVCDDLDGKLYLNVLLVVEFLLPKIRCWWKFVRAMLNSTLWNGPEKTGFFVSTFWKKTQKKIKTNNSSKRVKVLEIIGSWKEVIMLCLPNILANLIVFCTLDR